MKKVLSLFLLFIFLFNTVGYYFAYKSFQYQVKSEVQSEIKSGYDSDDLKTLTINKNDLHNIEWFDSGKEMRYNNKMYDIVRSTETSASITFYCIHDTKEESVLANLEEHINTHIANKPIKSDHQKKSGENVIKLYFSHEQSIKFNLVSFNQHIFFSALLIYNSTLIETDSPPPELV